VTAGHARRISGWWLDVLVIRVTTDTRKTAKGAIMVFRDADRYGSGLTAILAATWIVAFGPSMAKAVDYPEFTSTFGLNLVGSAVRVDDRLRLTAASAYNLGATWLTEKQQVQDGFVSTFQFQITSPGGTTDAQGNTGADGLAFVVQNDSLSAVSVYPNIGIGYSFPNSLAIEFDTYANSSLGDPNGNHVSVQTRGLTRNTSNHTYSLGCTTAVPNLSDGAVHTARIQYTPGTMSIYVDNLNVPALSVPLNLGSVLHLDSGKAWVGFTGATWAAWENHDILRWSCGPGTLSEQAAQLARQVADGNYLWGGKGYDFDPDRQLFVSVDGIKDSGYRYWDPDAGVYCSGGLGLDCSGLVLWAYDRAFYGDRQVQWADAVVTQQFLDAHGGRWQECVRFKESPVSCEGAFQQFAFNSYKIAGNELRAGDLLYFPGHIAMFVGDDLVVHAEHPTTGIVEESLGSFESKYGSRGICYRRVGKHDVVIVAHSPVDLLVTDPDGLLVSKELCSLPSADYFEYDLDGDGDLEDLVLIGLGRIGDYTVSILPQAGSSPDDTFSLWLAAGSDTRWLAQDVRLEEAPQGGYQFYSSVPEPYSLGLLVLGSVALLRLWRSRMS
jgi:cell wall-associated NlpC family hydrolase